MQNGSFFWYLSCHWPRSFAVRSTHSVFLCLAFAPFNRFIVMSLFHSACAGSFLFSLAPSVFVCLASIWLFHLSGLCLIWFKIKNSSVTLCLCCKQLFRSFCCRLFATLCRCSCWCWTSTAGDMQAMLPSFYNSKRIKKNRIAFHDEMQSIQLDMHTYATAMAESVHMYRYIKYGCYFCLNYQAKHCCAPLFSDWENARAHVNIVVVVVLTDKVVYFMLMIKKWR